jgi:hypothetical protein
MTTPERLDGRSALLPAEKFREVPCFPGYRVSSLGRVQSRHAPGGGPLRDEWSDLSQRAHAGGRRTVQLRSRGRSGARLVAELVLEAFVGPRPEGQEVRFVDGDPSNVRLDNVRWDSPVPAAPAPGRTAGSAHPRARLTEAAVVEMRRLRAGGMPLKDIAARFNVTIQHASHITTGRMWKHVPMPTPQS